MKPSSEICGKNKHKQLKRKKETNKNEFIKHRGTLFVAISEKAHSHPLWCAFELRQNFVSCEGVTPVQFAVGRALHCHCRATLPSAVHQLISVRQL